MARAMVERLAYVTSRQTYPPGMTVTVCRSPWYSRTSTVPGLRRLGASAPGLPPRAKPSRSFAVSGSSPPKACSWMCQQRNRATRSLVKAGGGDDRKVVRHRVRSSSIGEPCASRRFATGFALALRRGILGHNAVHPVATILLGHERQAELVAHHRGKEAADRVGLPSCRLHDGGYGCALAAVEHLDHPGLLRIPPAGRGPLVDGRIPAPPCARGGPLRMRAARVDLDGCKATLGDP